MPSLAHSSHIAGYSVVPLLPAAWECDLIDERLTWSPGVFALFGLDPATPVRRSDVVKLYAPESLAELERLRGDAIATGGSFTFEAWIRRGDSGDMRRIRIVADTVMRDGRAVLLYGQKFDITNERIGGGLKDFATDARG